MLEREFAILQFVYLKFELVRLGHGFLQAMVQVYRKLYLFLALCFQPIH